MSKVTFTEEEAKLAKEGLDFLINKGKFELTGVEAFKLSRQINVLSKVPTLINQYIFELKSIKESDSGESETKGTE